MTIAVFNKSCSKNVSGNSRIFIAEVTNVTAITVTSGEITSITGDDAFKEIEVDLDTILRIEEKIAGKLNYGIDVTVDMKLAHPNADLNTLRDSLVAASPCGMLAIVKDGNGTYWLVGYNELDLVTRPLYLAQDNFTSGAELIDPEGNKVSLQLARNMADPSLPLDSTLGTLIEDGTAEFIESPSEPADTWYVRPSGGSYGAEDGSGYENAWDGFANIDWTGSGVQPGDTLYICGTHTEALTVGGSGSSGFPITLRGDYPGDAGTIDSEDTRDTGLDCNSKNYITVTSLTSIDAVEDCFQFRGTSNNIITNDVVATGSGNQGIQHEDSASATHNNPYCDDNVDDGVSGHGTTVIVINGGTFSNNADGINVVEDSHCTVAGSLTFSGNSTHDIWAATATTNESCWINITGATLPVSARATAKGKIILTNCIVSGTLIVADITGTGYLTASGCTFSGTASFGADGDSTVTDSVFTSTVACAAGTTVVFTQCLITSWSGQVNGTITLSECYVKAENVYNDVLTAERTLFEGGVEHLCDIDNGCAATFKYCVFDEIASGKFGIAVRTGTTATVDGCTFVGASNVGKGLFTQVTVTANNCIFTDLNTGFQQSAGTATANNCVFFDNTADTAGTVVENNSQSGDPQLIDVANNVFNIGPGSSAIENGTDLGGSLDDGIDGANWGNGTSVPPTITTKDQSGSWDIGAHIS